MMSEQITADAGPEGAKPAGFWIRFAAYLLDTILIMIVGWLIAAVFGIGMVMDMDMADPEAMSGPFVGLQLSLVVLWVVYFSAFESSKLQATLGKLVVGVRVTDAAGGRIGIARAVGRTLAKYVSFLILMIGFIMAAFTDRKRGLHDMIAGTLVSYR